MKDWFRETLHELKAPYIAILCIVGSWLCVLTFMKYQKLMFYGFKKLGEWQRELIGQQLNMLIKLNRGEYEDW